MKCKGDYGSTAAPRRHFLSQSIQLSTTDIFCRKKGKYSTIKYCNFDFFQNPWIFYFSDAVLNSTTFPIFSAKNISST